EAWANRLAPRDNGGLALDGGATSCVLRRNVSHDNAGSGFLVYQFAGSRPTTDNLVIDNTSRNDGRTNGGGLVAGGGAVRTTFARNLGGLGPAAGGTRHRRLAVCGDRRAHCRTRGVPARADPTS